MKYVNNFTQYINESYLAETFQRFYFLVREEVPITKDNPMSVLMGKGRNKIFDEMVLTGSNYNSLPIQKGIPILNYTKDNDLIQKLLDEKLIDKTCLYNKPNESLLVDNKVIFHKVFRGSSHVPKTVFTIKDAETLKFPVIAKPKDGKSAEGIQKFNKLEDLKKSKEMFDLFSEAINIKEEYRCFCFKDDIMELNRREKRKGAKDFLKDSKTTTEFAYIKVNPTKFKAIQKLTALMNECRKRVSLDFYSLDFAEDVSGDLYLIEMNSRTGMGVDKMTKLYRFMYEDFYKRKLNKFSEEALVNLEKEWKEAFEKNIKGDY